MTGFVSGLTPALPGFLSPIWAVSKPKIVDPLHNETLLSGGLRNLREEALNQGVVEMSHIEAEPRGVVGITREHHGWCKQNTFLCGVLCNSPFHLRLGISAGRKFCRNEHSA